MDFLHKIGEKARELGETAKDLGGKAIELTKKSTEKVEAVKEKVEVVKLKFELNRMEKERHNNFTSLGELLFRRFKGEEGLDDEIERLLTATKELEERIRQLEEEIGRLAPRPLLCPECKVEIPAGGKYCPYCGRQVAVEKAMEDKSEEKSE